MSNNAVFEKSQTAWCPGCGNFSILDTLVQVLNDLGKDPRQVLLAAGIGQAAKTPQYVNANAFCGLHGRALPAAIAAKIANSQLTVIVDSGDGDSYGEGGNHFLHNIRRNVDITHFVHDNQVYGLTKGQVSPTTGACPTGEQDGCNRSIPFNPLLVALAAGATFVARGFSGKREHLAELMKQAIEHKGYALVDILQPCVSFNKVNTFTYYNTRTYELEADHNTSDRLSAMARAMEEGDRIPIGVFYKVQEPTFHDKYGLLANGTPLIDRKTDPNSVRSLMDGFL